MGKILAFGASNSSTSINKRLATYTASLFSEFETTVVDLNDYELPLFSVDLEKEIGHHENAVKFSKLIEESDGLIISLAEYNSNVTSAFKNLEDWVSRLDGPTWKGKKVFLLSTSNGKRGGKSAMEVSLKIMPFRGGDVRAHFSLPQFRENFHDTEGILDGELRIAFLEQVDIFRQALKSDTELAPEL